MKDNEIIVAVRHKGDMRPQLFSFSTKEQARGFIKDIKRKSPGSECILGWQEE